MDLSSRQINAYGKELVQSKFLALGIELSPTTDKEASFAAFSRVRQASITIKVKATTGPKPAGGKVNGRQHLTWAPKDPSSADIFAFVDLQSSRVWIIPSARLPFIAQQRIPGSFNFFMATDEASKPRRDGKPIRCSEFSEYLFENSASTIF